MLKSECQIGNRFVISKLLKIGNSKQKPCNTEETTSGLTISAPYTPTTPRELSDIRRACIWDFAGSPSSLPQLPGPKAQLVGSFRKLLLELWFVFVIQIIVAIFFIFIFYELLKIYIQPKENCKSIPLLPNEMAIAGNLTADSSSGISLVCTTYFQKIITNLYEIG